jgi:hypothetical protein
VREAEEQEAEEAEERAESSSAVPCRAANWLSYVSRKLSLANFIPNSNSSNGSMTSFPKYNTQFFRASPYLAADAYNVECIWNECI